MTRPNETMGGTGCQRKGQREIHVATLDPSSVGCVLELSPIPLFFFQGVSHYLRGCLEMSWQPLLQLHLIYRTKKELLFVQAGLDGLLGIHSNCRRQTSARDDGYRRRALMGALGYNGHGKEFSLQMVEVKHQGLSPINSQRD